MFIILGASGHVASVAANALLAKRQRVTAVLHDPAKADEWRDAGAVVAVVDVHDSDKLCDIFKTGERAFLLNPPAKISSDTDREENATVRSIVSALQGSGLERVVLESTMGAAPGERCGDLNVLYNFEQALAAQSIPATVQRAGYYFSNWDAHLKEARDGVLTTMLPADLMVPMVAPEDLGNAAARRLLRSTPAPSPCNIEGPTRYSAQNVADAFAESLGRKVELKVLPRDRWIDGYLKQGFSQAAAESYARMTAASIDGGFKTSGPAEYGTVTLSSYIAKLVTTDAIGN